MEPRNPVYSDDGAVGALRALISGTSFWAPEQLGPQPGWLEHAPFAFWLIDALRPRVFVELGIHGGYSYFAFCQAVRRLRLDTRCFAVDLWKGDEHAGFYGKEVYERVRKRNEQLYSKFSTLIRSSFKDALSRFDDATIDLLHIDGRHFYEDVKEDFENWRRKLSDRAVVLFHDTNVREKNFGVLRFWEELSGQYPHFEFLHGHGLGVLGVGSDLPPPVRALFAAGQNESATAAVRNAYSQLGLVPSLQFSSQTDAAQIMLLSGNLADTEKRAQALAAQVKVLSGNLADTEKRAQALAAQVKVLSGNLADAENRAAVLARLLEQRSSEVASAQNRATELDKALEARSAELAAVRIHATELATQAAAQNEELQSIKNELQSIKNSARWRLASAVGTLGRKAPWLTRAGRRVFRLLRRIVALRPRRQRPQDQPERQLILSSGLFDPEWYCQTYPDVHSTGVDPAMHYLRHGAPEGRDPNPLFSSGWYLRHYPDVKTAQLNPLVHYVRHGAAEGRSPGPLFDAAWYLERYPDVRDAGLNPLAHYLQYGATEGRERRAVTDDPCRSYQYWIETYDTLSPHEVEMIRRSAEYLPKRPLISIVMPVYNSDLALLEKAVNSVRAQIYSNWELCISDDASTLPQVRDALERYAREDERIRVVFRQTNGHISANSNTALSLATGEFVALLDADDELSPTALFWIAEEISRHPDADLIYSDEDKLDAGGRRVDPYFKPDWNPALMLSQNAFSHLGVFRRSLLTRVDGFRAGFEGSQDHDLVLRCAEQTTQEKIRHVPRVLYHWRAVAGSTASREGIKAKPYAWEAGARAIEEHLQRSGTPATVTRALNQFYQVEYKAAATPPKVSIVVPSAFTKELVCQCISGLLRRTKYKNFEILLAISESTAIKNRKHLTALASDPRVRVLKYKNQLFNYSAINNWAIKQSSAPIICLLNDDIDVITPEWLDRLVARVQLPEVGACGALLYYPDGTIQHAGVILGVRGIAGHAYLSLPKGSPGYFGRAALEQDLSCVTAACMVLRREAFDAAGGFNEDLAIAFNDVDLCVRLRQAGWRIIWTPTAELYHSESVSIGHHNSPERAASFKREIKLMRDTWADVLDNDPFYNPNLSLTSVYSDLAVPPRIAKIPDGPFASGPPAPEISAPRGANSQPKASGGLEASKRAGTNRSAATSNPAPATEPDPKGAEFAYYETRAPSPQNALDLFEKRWSSLIPDYGMGQIDLFRDSRIDWFLGQFGDIAGKRILELGPLEAGHTYMLAKHGAKVLAIEGNAGAYLKCLIAKETLGIDSQFLLGDFVKFVTSTDKSFDAVVASGVLYHMEKPLELIRHLARISNHILIWTHYFQRGVVRRNETIRGKFTSRPIVEDGVELWRYEYQDALQWPGFCGGPLPFSMWMTKAGLLSALQKHGFTVTVGQDAPDHPNGPALLLYAHRENNVRKA
jgi:glycosyltransferase involved in cell wall biosynthesis